MPPNQTQAFFPGDPHNPYPNAPYKRESLAETLLGLPVWVVFVISFFIHILGLLMIVAYYGYPPAKDPERGRAALWGVLIPFILGALFFGFILMLSALGHR